MWINGLEISSLQYGASSQRHGGSMARFLLCTLILAVVPMTLLNPVGRPAFLGYYLGIVTMWLVVVAVGRVQATAAATRGFIRE
jgi:hypothetical protein